MSQTSWDSHQPQDGSEGPELFGVRIAGAGPIREAFLALRPGLTVLYGLNGAGKSHVLRGVRSALVGDEMTSELHFRCPRDGWLLMRPQAPLEFFGGVRLMDSGQPADHEQYHEPLDDVLRDRFGYRLGADALGEDLLRTTLKLAAMQVSDSPTPLAALFESVLQFRYARRGNSLAITVVPSAAEPSSNLRSLWDRAMQVTAEMSAAELWTQVIRGRGPSDDDGEWDGEWSAFVGLNHFTSACRAQLGEEAPVWCGDLLWEEPGWGAWPAPVIYADELVDPTALTIEVLIRLKLSITRPGNSFIPTSAASLRDMSMDIALGVHVFGSNTGQVRRLGARNLGPEDLLVVGEDGSERVDPVCSDIAKDLGEHASRIFSSLLLGAPMLVCRLPRPSEWIHSGPVDWCAIDTSGRLVSISVLSEAQQRWARFSIRLALAEAVGEEPPFILIDEPERALHRLAEQHLATGLSKLIDATDAIGIVATHSPYLLGERSAHVHHVTRDRDGYTVVRELGAQKRRRIRELGLTPADLLHLCRTALLVEGRHEEVILETLFGDQLEAAGVEVFSMRGVTNLKTASDAQLLFRYTNARLVVLVDNDDHRRVADIWSRAAAAKADGASFDSILKEFTAGRTKSTEARFLRHFCEEALYNNRADRVAVTALSLADVIEYLPVSSLVPGAPQGTTWASLHDQHQRAAAGVYFKTWLHDTYGADFSDDSLRRAVGDLTSTPRDLAELLSFLRR